MSIILSGDGAITGLVNSADFVTYRGILRGLVISPVVDAVFPDAPVAIFN